MRKKKFLIVFSALFLITLFIVLNRNTEKPREKVDYTEFQVEDPSDPTVSTDLTAMEQKEKMEETDSICNVRFPNQNVRQILTDSFDRTPSKLLELQANALQHEQVQYGYAWDGVSVGYGMVPLCGNYGERSNLGSIYHPTILEKAKVLLFYPLIKNRSVQEELFEWAKATIDSVWSLKPDTAQALDMFAVWKSQVYLQKFNYEKEKLRAEKTVAARDYSSDDPKKTYMRSTFTIEDWYGKKDSDAKIYAFWFRRIREYKQMGIGFSLDDARYWSKKAYDEMRKKSKPNTLKLLENWKKLWFSGKITSVHFEF